MVGVSPNFVSPGRVNADDLQGHMAGMRLFAVAKGSTNIASVLPSADSAPTVSARGAAVGYTQKLVM